MKFEIVDKLQTFKDFLDGKVTNDEIEVVNFEVGEVWDMLELMASDVRNEKIIFVRVSE